MTSSILSATVASVSFGNLQIEGLLLETGEFAVGVPQIAALFPYFYDSQSQASQKLKRLMGEGFKTHKIKCFKQKAYALSVLLPDFEQILRKLDKANDPMAVAMVDDLIGLSLQQLFSDAFNIKFDKEERQLWLKHRQKHKEQFHPLLTHWLKQDANGDSSLVQWGVEVNEFKRAAKLPVKPIDEYSEGELDNLNRAEVAYNALRKFGVTHKQAVASLS